MTPPPGQTAADPDVRHVTSGFCDPRFERVREQFERNFHERDELGASVCVVLDGEPVVDVWGGIADPETGRPWERDTVNVIMSCSKGLTAMCGHILIDEGRLELDKPVADYWPQFARHGKGAIPVRQVFNHQSGVAHVEPIVPPGGFNDWELMIGLIEETPPFWPPGTRTGYHAMTIGWLIGELVRRISGDSVGRFFAERVAEPLALDCWIGLPEEHEHRVARTVFFDIGAEAGIPPAVYAALTAPGTRAHRLLCAALRLGPVRSAAAWAMLRQLRARQARDPEAGMLPPEFVLSLLDPRSAAFKLISNLGDYFELADDRAAHAAEIPASGAITNARGLAGAYTPLSLGGAHNGVRIVSDAAIERMGYPQSFTDVDACLGIRTCFTLGFSKSWPSPVAGDGVFIGEDAFGTPGLGGQIGFADPHHRLAFAYTMNRHGAGTGLNERGQSLVDETYRALGSPGREPGFWRRPR
jgi:CubicO group peptidase (beta-lactamase class C family)